MKRALRLVAILAGITIIGCNRIDLVAPALISPADGAALYTPPTFIWSSGEEAEEYVIHVWTGSTDVIEDTLTDTTYTMSDSAFSALAYGIYTWAVASKADSKLAWSESRTFSILQPGAPTLIAPEDGAVFNAEPPTFIWSSDSLEPDYVIRIFTDTTNELQDTLSDTNYVMSGSVFEALTNGTYSWWVGSIVHNGLILSGARTFTIDKPEPVTDLDTTYFPFGLGYEWEYERHHHGYEWNWEEGEFDNWSLYDTITASVIDSFGNDDTLLFELEGGLFFLSNPVKIWENQIVIHGYLTDTVNLTPSELTRDEWGDDGDKDYHWILNIGYSSDTLNIFSSEWEAWYFPPYDPEYSSKKANRLKGIGAIYQGSHYSYEEEEFTVYSSTVEYRLLTFTTPKGQVWP